MDMIVYKKTCIFCGANHLIPLDEEKYRRWRSGEHVQNVWPEMSADQREILISGTCPECWEREFGEDD
jgi:hypothetical protein